MKDERKLMTPRFLGVGYIGIGKYRSSSDGVKDEAYLRWSNMLKRCYSKSSLSESPSYVNCIVSDEWHNFQNFAEWFYEQYKEDGWHLDKDLLSEECKIYSKDTCVLIPQELNRFLTNSHRKNTLGIRGVKKAYVGDKFTARINAGNGIVVHLGTFNTPEEAGEAYDIKREEFASEWREKMKGILPDEAIVNIK